MCLCVYKASQCYQQGLSIIAQNFHGRYEKLVRILWFYTFRHGDAGQYRILVAGIFPTVWHPCNRMSTIHIRGILQYVSLANKGQLSLVEQQRCNDRIHEQ